MASLRSQGPQTRVEGFEEVWKTTFASSGFCRKPLQGSLCFQMAGGSAANLALELLLADDGVDQATLQPVLDHFKRDNPQVLSKSSQLRELFRLVKDAAATLPLELLDYLTNLAAWSQQDPAEFPPGVNLQTIWPPADLLLRVRSARRWSRP